MLKLEDQMLNDNLDSLFSGELGGGTGSDAGERGGGARPSGCERDGGRRQCGYKYGQVVTTRVNNFGEISENFSFLLVTGIRNFGIFRF